MASLLGTYAQTEAELKALQDKLNRMQEDPRLQQELEFKNKLEALMKEFDKSAADVLALLDPQGGTSSQSRTRTPSGRRKRRLKVYKNPNTGEVVETRGGNQKTLKAWKDEHGEETVESWLVRVED